MSLPCYDRVAILGVGLLGGSFGLALKERGLARRVAAYSRTPATRQRAVERGAADLAAESPEACVEGASLVYLATPVNAIVPSLAAVASHLQPGCLVTDAGSSKAEITAGVEALGLSEVRFVGGHPMTGSAEMGIDAACADLFCDMTYALTPTPATDSAALAELRELVTALGSHVLELAPAAHDRVVASTSHLPHLLAAALVYTTERRAQRGDPVYQLTAGSWASGTRVAASGARLWREILSSNRAAVLTALDDFAAALNLLREPLEAGDDEALEAQLEALRQVKLAHPGRVRS